MKTIEEHECVFGSDVDCDICSGCSEHSGFCEDCGESECCGAATVEMDRDTDMDR